MTAQDASASAPTDLRLGAHLMRARIIKPTQALSKTALNDGTTAWFVAHDGDEFAPVDTRPASGRRRVTTHHSACCTKELILDVYDRMAKAIGTGEPYQTILDPPPADPSLCHDAF